MKIELTRRLPLTGVFFLLVMVLVAVTTSSARAECAGGVDLENTPVGGQVCEPDDPDPTPTSSPSSSPSSSPKPSSKPKPKGSTAPTPAYSPFMFPTPAGSPLAFPLPSTAPLSDFGLPPGFTLPQPSQPPIGAAGQAGDVPSYFGTGPGLAGVRPTSEGGRFAPRAALLILLAAGGALWLRRARVRSWMIGF